MPIKQITARRKKIWRDNDIALMAHLMRRAGFGASYEELERRAAAGYEATVEELLNPGSQPRLEMDVLERRFVDWREMNALEVNQAFWTYAMINTQRPLEEKIALFWHGIFCTGNSKCEHGRQIKLQIDMFRDHGLGSFRDLLLGLSSDPSMIFYLDNCMSHKDAINENWGRELLELFSMGVGMDGEANYSEDDVKECARAFTGWTITNAIPRYPYGRYEAGFIYNPADHDEENKTFLGETGNFNGDDIIDLIARQQSTARFISRHMYNFFVADDVQVPAWQNTPPRDLETIKMLEDEYFRSGYNIGSMLRVLFQLRRLQERPLHQGEESRRGRYRHHAGGQGLHVAQAGYSRRGQQHPLHGPGPDESRPRWRAGTRAASGLTAAPWWSASTLPPTRWATWTCPACRTWWPGSAPTAAPFPPRQVVDRCLELLGAYELADDTREQLDSPTWAGAATSSPVQPSSPSGWARPCSSSSQPRSTSSPNSIQTWINGIHRIFCGEMLESPVHPDYPCLNLPKSGTDYPGRGGNEMTSIKKDPVLVVLQLSGGNDALNTVSTLRRPALCRQPAFGAGARRPGPQAQRLRGPEPQHGAHEAALR